MFENVGNMCLEVYEHDPAKLLSAPGLAWQPALKKTKVKLDLLNDIYRLLIVENGIRGGICNAIYGHAKANNKCMNDFDETKESSHINYWDLNYLYGWTMSQKLPVNNFKWKEETSQFNKDFVKNYDEKNEEGYIPEVDVQYPEKLYEFHGGLPFLPE